MINLIYVSHLGSKTSLLNLPHIIAMAWHHNNSFQWMINYNFETFRVVDSLIADLGGYIQHTHQSLLALGERLNELERNITDMKNTTKAMKAMKTMKSRKRRHILKAKKAMKPMKAMKTKKAMKAMKAKKTMKTTK